MEVYGHKYEKNKREKPPLPVLLVELKADFFCKKLDFVSHFENLKLSENLRVGISCFAPFH